MLRLSIGRVRIEQVAPPLPITYSLKCAIDVAYQGRAVTYDSIRLDHFLTEVVSTYISISFSTDAVRLYFDGYQAYALFEGRTPISLTISDPEFPANVRYFDYSDIREFMLGLIQQMSAGLRGLDLPRKELLEVRQLFRYGGLLLPFSELP